MRRRRRRWRRRRRRRRTTLGEALPTITYTEEALSGADSDSDD